MAITAHQGRQELLHAYVDINFADLVSGSDLNAIEVEPGAAIVSGAVVKKMAFNSATSDVLDVGYSGVQNAFANDINIAAAGAARTEITPTGFVHTTATRWITVRWVGVGAVPTAGKVRLEIQYYIENRACYALGH